MASKRKTLCVNQKVALIRAVEQGEKKSDVGRRLGLSPSTVATIWKSKEKILQAETEGSSCKKLRKPKFEDLDQAMLLWFHKQRFNNVPITGPIVKAKAEKFAAQLGITGFKASEGWLGKFKQRHHINYGQLSGETGDVDMNVSNGWLNKVWPKLKEKYSLNDIFNADEAGIFYKMTPDKTLKFKGEKCLGVKLSEDCITALEATNMSGTEERKLTVIGKSKNPQCSKNIKRLPVTYEVNQFHTPHTFTPEDLQNYAKIEGDLFITVSVTDDKILNPEIKVEKDQNEDEVEEQSDDPAPPSIQQALDAAKLLEKFFLFHEDDPELSQDMDKLYRKIQTKYWHSKQLQRKMTDYFK